MAETCKTFKLHLFTRANQNIWHRTHERDKKATALTPTIILDSLHTPLLQFEAHMRLFCVHPKPQQQQQLWTPSQINKPILPIYKSRCEDVDVHLLSPRSSYLSPTCDRNHNRNLSRWNECLSFFFIVACYCCNREKTFPLAGVWL